MELPLTFILSPWPIALERAMGTPGEGRVRGPGVTPIMTFAIETKQEICVIQKHFRVGDGCGAAPTPGPQRPLGGQKTSRAGSRRV